MLRLMICAVCICQAYGVPCSQYESVNITNGVRFPNDSVIHNNVEYTRDAWYEVGEDDGTVWLGCPCVVRVCLWKCCGMNQAYINRTCSDTDLVDVTPFNPPVFKGMDVTDISAYNHFFYMYNLSCEKYSVDSSMAREELYLQENGTLYEIVYNDHEWHPPSGFCLDMMVDERTPAPRLMAGVCYPEDGPTDDSPVLYITYGIGLILSVPFLLGTFLVYAFVPELRNLHGMSLMAYCGGLIIAYTFLAYLKLHVGKIGVGMTGCYIIAFITYFAFQTSFFWLNVMCFDIWRTFSGYRGGGSNKKQDIKRFIIYGVYAWGVPTVLTVITIMMQFGDMPPNIIIPGFGKRRCWFKDWHSELVYFYSPVLLLVVSNVILFAVTANRIRSIRQETAILKSAESSRSDKLKKDKQRYSLYLKLFVVMGVNWTVEIVGFVIGGSNWYWVVIDIANIVLGVYIFFLFVWKKKVRNLVAKRWRSVCGTRAMDSSAGQSSSAPTEDTRVSTEASTIRLREIRQ